MWKKYGALIIFFSVTLGMVGCSRIISNNSSNLNCYYYSINACGCSETVDNIQSLSIVSKDANDFKAEYLAGFIQGKLQKASIKDTRDNIWDNTYLDNPTHPFPKQIPPSAAELETIRQALLENYAYTVNYVNTLSNLKAQRNLKRLIFRLLGIYHGVAYENPSNLDFSGSWLPDLSYFTSAELRLGYNTASLTFMDIYFINGSDDAFSTPIESASNLDMHGRCSAFIKKYQGDIAIAHNTWSGFLDQSLSSSFYINGLYHSFNMRMPGLIASQSDFGYTSNGLMYTGIAFLPQANIQGKRLALWGIWQAALSEQFSTSLDEFYEYWSMNVDNMSGTSPGGYLVVDTKTNEIATIEVSQQSYVYIKSNGSGSYNVTTNPSGLSTQYDTDMVNPNYIIAINYPASTQIRNDLNALDSRPARKVQFLNPTIGINSVADIASAKALITYTDPTEPLSIYGRWDLGYGTTPTPKTVPKGSIDAKAIVSSMTGYAENVSGILDTTSPNNSIWMKFGTPTINGKPFIWSESQWSNQLLKGVPDRVDGNFQLLRSYIK